MEGLLFDKTVSCPICHGEFTTKLVKMSACRLIKKDEDFCPHYKDIVPYAYDVWVCPYCGYSALLNHFSEIKDMDKKLVRNGLMGKWVEKSYGGVRTIDEAIQCYKLALLCLGLIDGKNSQVANICMRIAWLYRLENNKEEENRFLTFALSKYKQAYSTENLPIGNLNDATLGYLIGEVSRRVGNYPEAINWYSNAVSNPRIKNHPAIEKMAREQWYQTKEEIKNKKQEGEVG